MKITKVQREVLQLVATKNTNGTVMDIDQLLVVLSHAPSKQAFQFTLRYMIKKELIRKAGRETRRGAGRITYEVTALGMHFAYFYGLLDAPSIKRAIVEDDMEAIVLV